MFHVPHSTFHDRGFTILEAIIALGIFTAATTITVTFIFQGYAAHRFALETSDAVGYAHRGIQAMAKEIREARFAENGDYPILSADAQSFSFYSDVDADTVIEKTRYFLDSTTLKRGRIEPVGAPPTYPMANEVITEVAQYVRNGATPVFSYYTGAYPAVGTPLSTPADPLQVRLVMLHLEINLNPATAPKFFSLDEAVHLRNLKENL